MSVTINGDTTVEGNETFFVNLSNATNAAIGDPQGVGTITTADGVLLADLAYQSASDQSAAGAPSRWRCCR